jgi:hypothetical protein
MAQFKKGTNEFLNNSDTLFETSMIATKDGEVVDATNPLPVTLGSDTITITGNVNVGTAVEITNEEGNDIPVHAHIFDENDVEYSTSNPYPVTGTVSANVSGTVSVDNFPATQTVDGTVNIGTMPTVYINDYHQPSAFAAIDNYDDAGSNAGWKFQDDWIPAFGLRVKPGSETEFHLIDFSVTLNGGTSVVAGYRWHMNATLRDAYTWVDLGSTGIQYVKFDDIDDTPNLITSDTMVHSKAMVGKSTQDLTPEMKTFPFTDGGIEMFLEIRRLDGGGTQDMFYHLTMGID